MRRGRERMKDYTNAVFHSLKHLAPAIRVEGQYLAKY